MSEYVGGAPQEVNVASLLHLLQCIVSYGLHVGLILVYIVRRVYQVYVVEAEVVYAQLLHDFKSGVHLILGALQSCLGLVPGIRAGLAAKLVSAGRAQCVPPSHGKLEPVLHCLSSHYLVLVIVVKCHGVLAGGTLKGYLANLWEILFYHND